MSTNLGVPVSSARTEEAGAEHSLLIQRFSYDKEGYVMVSRVTEFSPTQEQKVLFQLSIYSNLVSGQTGEDLEPLLYERIRHYLGVNEQFIGKWEVVWGPSVTQFRTDLYAVDAMYLAQSLDDPKKYALAVAGTNPKSIIDSLVENFLVFAQVPWPRVPGAKISLSTAIELLILLTARPKGDRPNAHNTLVQYLRALPDKNINLQVTGASQGATASGTLALWLKDIQPSWDQDGQASILAMTTAGATAGNSIFAKYSDEKLEMHRYANTLDIGPYAWKPEALDGTKAFYEGIGNPFIPLIDFLKGLGASGDYLQVQPDAPPIRGVVNESIIKPELSQQENFLKQALYQHEDVYLEFLRIPGAEAPIIHPPGRAALGPVAQMIAQQAGLPIEPELAVGRVHSGPLTVPISSQVVTLPSDLRSGEIGGIVERVASELEKAAAQS